MSSLILTATARFLMPLLIMFSLFLLLRGHSAPGGGFAGGLEPAVGFTQQRQEPPSLRVRRLVARDGVLGVVDAIGERAALLVVLDPLHEDDLAKLRVFGEGLR